MRRFSMVDLRHIHRILQRPLDGDSTPVNCTLQREMRQAILDSNECQISTIMIKDLLFRMKVSRDLEEETCFGKPEHNLGLHFIT